MVQSRDGKGWAEEFLEFAEFYGIPWLTVTGGGFSGGLGLRVGGPKARPLYMIHKLSTLPKPTPETECVIVTWTVSLSVSLSLFFVSQVLMALT